MSKKIISIILCGTLVFCSFSTCFAVSTDSSIKATNELKSNDLRANPPDGSSSNPYYINPQSSSGTRYYVNDSSGTISSSSVYVTTWGDLMNHLSYTIAYSLKAVTTRLGNILTNLNSYLNSTASSTYYYWDWTPSNGVQQGAPESAENIVTAIRNIGMQLTKSLSYNTEYTYQISSDVNDIAEYITSNGAFEEVKIKDNTDNGFSKSYLWEKYGPTTISNNTIPWFTGRSKLTQAFNAVSTSVLGQITYRIQLFQNSMVNLAVSLVGSIGSYNLTKSDLTSDALGSDSSLQRDIRQIGSNLSLHLARLAYVLASDEEIEARQAAATNQDAVVDDFIKPTGSGSASASDFADVASIGGTMKDALDSNVSAGSAFTSLSSSSDAWNWFSTDTANSLDTTSNQRTSIYSTPFLDNYYSEVLENLRFK